MKKNRKNGEKNSISFEEWYNRLSEEEKEKCLFKPTTDVKESTSLIGKVVGMLSGKSKKSN